jgi:hypothetical protein
MAERVGFEPTRPLSEPTRFPVVSLQPLGHRSEYGKLYPIAQQNLDTRTRCFGRMPTYAVCVVRVGKLVPVRSVLAVRFVTVAFEDALSDIAQHVG